MVALFFFVLLLGPILPGPTTSVLDTTFKLLSPNDSSASQHSRTRECPEKLVTSARPERVGGQRSRSYEDPSQFSSLAVRPAPIFLPDRLSDQEIVFSAKKPAFFKTPKSYACLDIEA